MLLRRLEKRFHRVPYVGDWIEKKCWEHRLKQSALKNARLSQEEIIARVRRRYLQAIGRLPDLENPRAFSEKITWRKLYERDERFSRLTDKYLVREWVARTVGEQYLIPLLGVWDRAGQIDFSALPSSFVLKANNASGANLLVENAGRLNKRLARRQLDFWQNCPYPYRSGTFELHYLPIRPRIVCEAYMRNGGAALRDYKFLCFHGEPRYVWVDIDRFSEHHRNVYTLDWEKMPWQICYPGTDRTIPRPDNLAEMIRVARALCQGFDHVRVDLYDINGQVYFGEMTFTSDDGRGKTVPDEADFLLGDLWRLDTACSGEALKAQAPHAAE